MTDPKITVTQAAREAAADLMRNVTESEYVEETRSGDYDDNYFVQAFAAFEHRLAATRTPPVGEVGELVERLRKAVPVLRSWGMSSTAPLVDEAAATIAAQQARIASLSEALEPFRSVGDLLESETVGMDDTDTLELMLDGYLMDRLTVGDFVRARAALSSNADGMGGDNG